MSKQPVARGAVLTKSPRPSNAVLQKEVVKLQGEINQIRSASHKHAGTGKHHHHPAKGKHAHHAAKGKHGKAAGKKRGLALGDAVACCAAEAVAASARLAGHAVGDADVLALHHAAGGSADEAVTIEEALTAASVHGIGGVRPARFAPAEVPLPGVILGMDLPGGPHAVTLDTGLPRVWSWGGLWLLRELEAGPVQEAWQVAWS